MRISDWSSDVCSSDLWKGLPSSSSHALIGGLCGAGVSAAHNDWAALIWSEPVGSWKENGGLLWKVVLRMVMSPAAGFEIGIVVVLLLWARSADGKSVVRGRSV